METQLLEVLVRNLATLLQDKKISSLDLVDQEFLSKYTYDAISLEGTNRMPYEKVKHLIELDTKPDYSEKEINEVLNHVKCFNTIKKWALEKSDLLEDDIKDLHNMLEANIYVGGIYRNVNIQIRGAIHQPPSYVKVYDRMKRMFDDLKRLELNDFDKAIFIHANLAKIHPFLDGNGRLGRLVLNFYLIKLGYLPITISIDNRNEYFESIDKFKVDKDLEPLKNFVIKELILRYETIIEQLED